MSFVTIDNLLLENFRCYRKREFKVSPAISLVIGRNTSGKTSLLEAVFLLASGRSPRAGLDREMVSQGAPFASVVGKIDRPVPAEEPRRLPAGKAGKTPGVSLPTPGVEEAGEESAGSKELEVQLIARENSPTLTTKRFKVNGVARRLGDFLPQFHAVLFSPEDLDLVTGRPDRRRRFMDFALASGDSRYRRALREYDKVRKRRNRVLEQINKAGGQKPIFSSVRTSPPKYRRGREPSSLSPASGIDLEGLRFWDAKLLEFGTFLQDERKKFFDEINSLLHNSFFIIHYSVSDLTAERLQELRPREIAAETTLVGPHRDDFEFTQLNGSSTPAGKTPGVSGDLTPGVKEAGVRDLAKFGSRSEQRRAVLALKKAEMEFVEGKIGERPVLLLDDIFSELDEDNRGRVAKELVGRGSFDSAQDKQVIVTTADIQHIPAELREDSRIIEL